MEEDLINWLTEDSNPMVKFRTRKEILKQNVSNEDSKRYILSYIPENWYMVKGIWYTYYLTALAEAGLTAKNIDRTWLEQAFLKLKNSDHGCEDFMLLRALLMLGFGNEEPVQDALSAISESALPDGGFLCRMKLDKKSYVPKGCYKANLMALLLASECQKKNIIVPYKDALVRNFVNRRLFYKNGTDDLVLQEKEGWRTVDVFSPLEVMRIGIVNIYEALANLLRVEDPALAECSEMIKRHIVDDKVILQGTSTKTYLPKEKVGKPSKWNSFYYLLALSHL